MRILYKNTVYREVRWVGQERKLGTSMCTNYKAPNEDPGIDELKLGIGDLYRRDPWEPDVYPDYAAPIAWAEGDGLGVVKAVFGFWPKFMQPERLDERGRKRRKLDTMNARAETVGESRLYGNAWRTGQRCLIPAHGSTSRVTRRGAMCGSGLASLAGNRIVSPASGAATTVTMGVP